MYQARTSRWTRRQSINWVFQASIQAECEKPGPLSEFRIIFQSLCDGDRQTRLRWPCSNWSNCASRFCSDSVSGIQSKICTRRLSTWNSISIMASNLNPNWKGVDFILVLNVRYATYYPNRCDFRWWSSLQWSAKSSWWIRPGCLHVSNMTCFFYALGHSTVSSLQ